MKEEEMNKKELAVELSKRVGLSQVKSMEVLNALFDCNAGILPAELVGGRKISIPGFGTFSIKVRAARTGTNPSNQRKITIPSKKFPAFRPGKTLKEVIVA
jgi:nucleoid DNA-binding protein